MPKKTPKVTPKLEAELRDKLEDLLDEHDDVALKKKRVAKALKGHLTILDDAISLVRRQLKGQDLDQLEIPGAEVPAPAQDPVVSEILKLAGGIVERKADPEDEDDDAGEEPQAAKRPPPLPWRELAPGRIVAVTTGGEYVLEETPSGGFTATWRPSQGRQKALAVAKPKAEAMAACVEHHVERFADDLLRNAGDGDLTKGDLKGPPEAFRRGGRRG
jgi:hypothetical protein